MLRAFCLALALVGCGEPEAREVDTDVEAAPTASPEPTADPPLPKAPPSFDARELDAMDEPALEAACFAGSMTACDRLDIARCDRPQSSDDELDAMDEPALEAACFAGSTAACDRLGH